MKRTFLKVTGLLLPSLLAGCATTSTPSPTPILNAPPPSGLDRVIGRDARALQILFGVPDLDVREGAGRKLQYAGPICVLDAYLYPPTAGREPIVRHLDARTPAGDDFDRASCIAALSRRPAAR